MKTSREVSLKNAPAARLPQMPFGAFRQQQGCPGGQLPWFSSLSRVQKAPLEASSLNEFQVLSARECTRDAV